MPIPTPKPGEKKDKFISGCMSELKDEFPDVPQRYAVCIGSWLDKYSTTIGKFWYKKKNDVNRFVEDVQTIKLKIDGNKNK